jgi:hypothetical protein
VGKVKKALYANGTEALEDFLGFDLNECYDEKVVEEQLEDIAAQMPDDIQVEFYRKYVPNDTYVNDDGDIATICEEHGGYVAYIEPKSVKIGRHDTRAEVVHELTSRGFYESER